MQNPDGTPIWFELTTADVERAQAFYADVIGWAVAPSGMEGVGDYRIANAADDAMVAGITTCPDDSPLPSGWSVYFGVADVDAAATKIVDLGGSVLVPPQDIAGVGRFALVADPQGVVFYVMHGEGDEASTAFLQGPGKVGHGVWTELATPDPDAAFAFYGALFGWTREDSMPMGRLGDYTFIGVGATRPGAVMSSVTTGADPRWQIYFHVRDIDAAVGSAKAGAGALVFGPDSIPGGDYSAKLTDADGAAFGVVGPRKGA